MKKHKGLREQFEEIDRSSLVVKPLTFEVLKEYLIELYKSRAFVLVNEDYIKQTDEFHKAMQEEMRKELIKRGGKKPRRIK